MIPLYFPWGIDALVVDGFYYYYIYGITLLSF